MAEEKNLYLPGSSWETVKKIIRAFYAAQNEESPRVEDIAKLAGVPRPVVSMNNNFLRSVGIVRQDGWKLTDLGIRYAMGLARDNSSLATENLSAAVRLNPVLNQLLNLLRARGTMKPDSFKAEIMILLDLHEDSRQIPFIRPLLDMLNESGIVQVSDEGVSLRESDLGPKSRVSTVENKMGSPKPLEKERHDPVTGIRLPLPLGPGRLAYIELPDGWDQKELPKLLKILELALGDSL
jgi:hypothetical protein